MCVCLYIVDNNTTRVIDFQFPIESNSRTRVRTTLKSGRRTNIARVITWRFSSVPFTLTRDSWWRSDAFWPGRLAMSTYRPWTIPNTLVSQLKTIASATTINNLNRQTQCIFDVELLFEFLARLPRTTNNPKSIFSTDYFSYFGSMLSHGKHTNRYECVQRGDHVRDWWSGFVHLGGRAGRFLRHNIDFYHLLHHWHPLSRLRS